MLAWSQTRFFVTLAVAALLVMEPVSWITAPIPGGCLVKPENYAPYYSGHDYCPTFHIFLIDLATRVFRHFGDPNWVIADFTAVLAFSTICLWAVTWRASIRQSRDMEASIAVATRAAENAEKALHALEVPHIFPVNMSFKTPEDAFGAPQSAFISVSLKNFGRSPGFLKQVYIIAAVVRLDRRHTTEFHSGKKYFMPDDVIGDKEIFGPLTVEIQELARYAHQIGEGGLQLGVLVHHDTEDLMDRAVGRGAWYVLNPKTGRFSPGVQLWAAN
jgi:hypothetical protein